MPNLPKKFDLDGYMMTLLAEHPDLQERWKLDLGAVEDAAFFGTTGRLSDNQALLWLVLDGEEK